MTDPANLQVGQHRFCIEKAESCMIRTVTLSVVAELMTTHTTKVAVFLVTEGDYLWNTLVVDGCENEAIIDLMPVFEYLHSYAKFWAAEYPQPLKFSSQKQASRFSKKIIRCPVNVRGVPYAVPYPGSK